MVRLKFRYIPETNAYELKDNTVVSQDGKMLAGYIKQDTKVEIVNVATDKFEFEGLSKNLAAAKKLMKTELQKLGVHFDKEVRNRRKKPESFVKFEQPLEEAKGLLSDGVISDSTGFLKSE